MGKLTLNHTAEANMAQVDAEVLAQREAERLAARAGNEE